MAGRAPGLPALLALLLAAAPALAAPVWAEEGGQGGCRALFEAVYPDRPFMPVDSDGDLLFEVKLGINLWNVERADGYAVMRYCDGVITYEQDFYNITLKVPAHFIHGYPAISYGTQIWDPFLVVLDGPVPLPLNGAEMGDIIVEIAYSIEHDPDLPVNTAFDLWFTPEYWRDAGGRPGDFEVMIWLYRNILVPFGVKVGEANVTLVINGEHVEATFEIYRNPEGSGSPVSFSIKQPMSSANVTLNITWFILKAFEIAEIDPSKFYLQEINFGSEYGTPQVTEARMRWTVERLAFAYHPKPLNVTVITWTETVTQTLTETLTATETVTETLTVTVEHTVYRPGLLVETVVVTKTVLATVREPTLKVETVTETIETTIRETVAPGTGRLEGLLTAILALQAVTLAALALSTRYPRG